MQGKLRPEEEVTVENGAIVLENVNKQLGTRDVLRNVSLAVDRGDIFGFLGPNGAGKTTTIRIILGLLPPSGGRVRVLGQEIGQPRTRQRVGFLLEADGLYEGSTAYDNLAYYARIYGVDKPQEVIAGVLKSAGLADRARDKVSAYSKGMRQRLGFARALLHDPELLVLDEPTAGVDPTGQMEMRQLFLDEVRQRGKTIFLSSHNLDEVQRICNRIALINKGEIRLCGDRESLQRQAGKGKVVVETAETVSAEVITELARLPKLRVDSQMDKTLVLSLSNGTGISDIVSFLSQRGVRIEGVRHEEASLEDVYASILKEAQK